jgi:hypothetical protein
MDSEWQMAMGSEWRMANGEWESKASPAPDFAFLFAIRHSPLAIGHSPFA